MVGQMVKSFCNVLYLPYYIWLKGNLYYKLIYLHLSVNQDLVRIYLFTFIVDVYIL